MTLPLIEVKELDQHGNDTSFATHNQPCNQWTVQILAQANGPATSVRDWARESKAKTPVKVHEWPDFSK